ncbi:hypothetical protein J7T55_009246 [Diaporthe amygdali]|uniref:uncharacterized protein n=1 Tax=Phomopsis amygdali TaxID=1214568 RepID=UPI0022FF3D9A|nr:uncharacterized protein J7T55_009246 [Diaporthe amygdali]KAJ0118463.1 hypothetical protein J7T55_009246 [Diaporthe amygdali]
MVCTTKTKADRFPRPSSRARMRAMPRFGCRNSKQDAASGWDWGRGVRRWETGDEGMGWALEENASAGKREAGALSIAGVTLMLTLTLSLYGGLARQSQRRTQSLQGRLGPFLYRPHHPPASRLPGHDLASRPPGYRFPPWWCCHARRAFAGAVAASTTTTATSTLASLSSTGPPARYGGIDPLVSGFIRGQGTGRACTEARHV